MREAWAWMGLSAALFAFAVLAENWLWWSPGVALLSPVALIVGWTRTLR